MELKEYLALGYLIIGALIAFGVLTFGAVTEYRAKQEGDDDNDELGWAAIMALLLAILWGPVSILFGITFFFKWWGKTVSNWLKT